jgi:hypothetical protein
VTIEVVTEEGFDVNSSINRDPPFIFEREVRGEEKLEGTDPLDRQGGGRGVGEAELKRLLVRAVGVRDEAISIEPHVTVVGRSGVVNTLLVRIVRVGEELV